MSTCLANIKLLLYNNCVKSLLDSPWLLKIINASFLLPLMLVAAATIAVLIATMLFDEYARAATISLPLEAEIAIPTATALPVLPLAQVAASGAERLPSVAPMIKEPTPLPTYGPYYADANELGKIMVLEYHRIAYPETRYQRSPVNFRADLQRMVDNDYYPVNLSELTDGLKTVPSGKRPILLTFDDSDSSQFWVMDDRTVDPESALGLMLDFHNQHPAAWPLRATFFVLGDDTADHLKIFGQAEWAKQKLEVLVELGMEIGSHTVSHVDLSLVSEERLEWELAVSQHVIEELVPGYSVQTLSVPYGGFPWSIDLLKDGNWQDYTYHYTGNVAAWGGPTLSPHDPAFDPYRVSRIEVSDIWTDHWFTYYDQNPDEYYTSDGDPNRLTIPRPKETAPLLTAQDPGAGQ
jgi:peptidoglycan/xylan/chitin deacetylase (PgdA/CDA1 family)